MRREDVGARAWGMGAARAGRDPPPGLDPDRGGRRMYIDRPHKWDAKKGSCFIHKMMYKVFVCGGLLTRGWVSSLLYPAPLLY